MVEFTAFAFTASNACCRDIVASWAGGEDGREVIDRVLPIIPQVLTV
jgi:hypothetical protein